jgi:hypothetical protein
MRYVYKVQVLSTPGRELQIKDGGGGEREREEGGGEALRGSNGSGGSSAIKSTGSFESPCYYVIPVTCRKKLRGG